VLRAGLVLGSRDRPEWVARGAIAAGVLVIVAGCASGTSRVSDPAPRIAVPPSSDRPIAVRRSSAPAAPAVVRVAMRYVGTPYLWGGVNPSGFDCSGFVRYVYARLGIPLPRTVREQYQVGVPVARDRLRPGDIVFFDRLRHNGVYIGDARLIHASTQGGRVDVARLDEPWFRARWVGARRPGALADGPGGTRPPSN